MRRSPIPMNLTSFIVLDGDERASYDIGRRHGVKTDRAILRFIYKNHTTIKTNGQAVTPDSTPQKSLSKAPATEVTGMI